jgi:hypothetical protein
MRTQTLVFLIFSLALAAGCAAWSGPSVLRKGTNEQLDAEALRVAKEDVAAGRPRVAYAGTVASGPVGVPAESLELVSKLPKFSLPSGCMEPMAFRSMRFAHVYNTEILRHLSATVQARFEKSMQTQRPNRAMSLGR